jgi:DNA replication protein DnaC
VNARDPSLGRLTATVTATVSAAVALTLLIRQVQGRVDDIGHADRTWPRRLAELTRPALLILDDFAMRELTAQQADDLYELVSERAQAGRSLIITANRSPADWYPLFPNPVVAESLLDRLINTSHQVFMNGPSYRPNKSPTRASSTTKPNTK